MRHPILVTLALAIALPAAAQQRPVAITGATLVNPEAAPVADAVVVFRDGRILAAGPRARVAIPAGAQRIDASGKWLVPGYIDAHVHFFQSAGLYARPDGVDLQAVVPYEREIATLKANLDDTFRRYLRAGVTTVMDVGGPMWNFEVRERAAKAPLAPTVLVAGPLVSTIKAPVVSDMPDPAIIQATSPAHARALVQEQLAHKPDLVKVWYVLERGQEPAANAPLLRAAIEKAHAHGVRVAVHATELEGARLAVQSGADLLVHGIADKPVDAAFIDLLRQRKVPVIPTLAVMSGHFRTYAGKPALTPEEQAWGNPDIIATLTEIDRIAPDWLPAALRPMLARLKSRPVPAPETDMKNLKAMRDGGVVIATGTDAGNPAILPGASYFRELGLMHQAGLSPAQILADSTLHGARALGREKDLGSIAAGKQADMLLLDADPLSDVAHFSRIHTVVVRGNPLRADEILAGSTVVPVPRNPEAFKPMPASMQPEAVVQRQLEAYNARDVEAFLATYDPQAELFGFPSQPQARGHAALRAMYAALFARSPQLKATVDKRIVQGSFVIDRERVTGMPGLPEGQAMEAVAIYEVVGGRIRRVWFIQ